MSAPRTCPECGRKLRRKQVSLDGDSPYREEMCVDVYVCATEGCVAKGADVSSRGQS